MTTNNALAGEVLALDPDVLQRILAGSATPVPARQASTSRRGVIAVIPIMGGIDRRHSVLAELLGGTSIEAIRRELRAAAANPDVRGIVLEVDSPGGSVAGVTELAAEIRAARDLKPVFACVDTTAASAAFWVASQADGLYVVPSGQVGSIGVFAVHYDISRALDREGITPTIIASDPRKVEGNEYEPLADDARTRMQQRVNASYRTFVGDVAKGRRVSTAHVLGTFGGGALVLAQDALAAGMVDGIATLDDVLAKVAAAARSAAARAPQPSTETRRSATSFDATLEAARDERDRLALHTQVHESGHAVMAARIGAAPTVVKAFTGTSGEVMCSTRTTSLAILPNEDRAATGRRLILLCRAGEAAVEVAGFEDPGRGCDYDRGQAIEAAKAYGLANPEAESAAAYAKALAILREDDAEPLARMTAALRANEGRLAGEELTDALRNASRPIRLFDAARRDAVDTVARRSRFELAIGAAEAAGIPITDQLLASEWRKATDAARKAATA